LEYGSDEKFINKYLIESTSGIGLKLKSNAAVILGFVRPKNEDLLIEAIKRLKEQTHREFDIFVYDNSEIENSLEKTRSLFPDVYIKKNAKNCGFAGGNNSVMREVLKTNNYDYIVLLNDDTQVSPDWLKSLIEMAEENQEYGAVTSKLIFYEPFVRLQFSTQTFNPKKEGISEDTRDLGIKLYTGETRFEHTHYSKKFLREGLYGLEGEFSWSSNEFFLDIPVGYNYPKETYTLLLSLEGASQISNQTLKINIGSFNTELKIVPEKQIYTVEVPRAIIEENKFNLIQNAGSGITAQFNGYDIGSLNGNAEIDKGQYDEPREVEMICGGAVLFKADVLRTVGLFDEYYFVYYEDSDLSLRIRKAGYKLMYQPKALVRHIHAGSSTEYSPFFTYHVWKNKPVFVIKNFSIRPILFAFKELTKIQLQELKNAAKHKFRNGYHNSRLKVILKSSIKFYSNLPLVLLKKFNIVKSV
jgi:GT2 family glycosyltransferase